MKRPLILSVAAAAACLVFALLGVLAASDLEIFVGNKRHKVDSRDYKDKEYYELQDLAQILKLQLSESAGKATLTGPRGELLLTDGRPLVSYGGEYILLNQPVWRRKEKNWYVPEDFVEKCLPLVLNQKLERLRSLSYRVQALTENSVQVEITNFPDHVRITFKPVIKVPIRVRESGDYIQVNFEDHLVVPSVSRTRPNTNIVAELQFLPLDVYGVFRISKGDRYYNFREYDLERGQGKVVDVYAPPRTAQVPEVDEPRPAIEPEQQAPTGTQPLPAPPELIPVFKPRQFSNIVTLDPGHGGEDAGVRPNSDDLEKDFTLKVAQRVEQQLRNTPYRAVLTRTTDAEVPISQRSAIGNYYQSKCYVSIHAGTSSSKESRSPVVYIHRYQGDGEGAGSNANGLVSWEEGQRAYAAKSRQLAESIQKELNAAYGSENKVIELPLAVLAPVTAPAIVVEAQLSSSGSDPESADRLVAALIRGVLAFLH